MKFLTKQKDTSEFDKKVYIDDLLYFLHSPVGYVDWKLFTRGDNRVIVYVACTEKSVLTDGIGSTFSECLDQMRARS